MADQLELTPEQLADAWVAGDLIHRTEHEAALQAVAAKTAVIMENGLAAAKREGMEMAAVIADQMTDHGNKSVAIAIRAELEKLK